MIKKNNFQNQHSYSKDNQQQIKNILTNQERIQHKQLVDYRISHLANNDFSCMMKKD